MVKIEFLGPINKESMSLDITSIKELSEVLKDDEAMVKWLENCAVAVNDTLISSKDIALSDGDKVSLLPPVCGG
ncbi:MAG: MoaD/ThiS family protein [Halarcobacter sp.]